MRPVDRSEPSLAAPPDEDEEDASASLDESSDKDCPPGCRGSPKNSAAAFASNLHLLYHTARADRWCSSPSPVGPVRCASPVNQAQGGNKPTIFQTRLLVDGTVALGVVGFGTKTAARWCRGVSDENCGSAGRVGKGAGLAGAQGYAGDSTGGQSVGGLLGAGDNKDLTGDNKDLIIKVVVDDEEEQEQNSASVLQHHTEEHASGKSEVVLLPKEQIIYGVF